MKVAVSESKGTLALQNSSGATLLSVNNGNMTLAGNISIINNNSTVFSADTSGNLALGGNITLGGNINMTGNIVWGNNSPVQYQFSVNGTSSWHTTMTSSDMYRRDSLDGGVTWGDAYQFRGSDGADGDDASVTSSAIFNILTDGGTKFGIFSDSSSSRLYINADYIKSGTVVADYIRVGGEMTVYRSTSQTTIGGYIGYCSGVSGGGVSTNGIGVMYDSDAGQCICTSAGARLTHGSSGTHLYVVNGQIGSSVPLCDCSDRNLKHDIQYTMYNKYAQFYRSLKPSFFKFNNGQSGRYHTGFISQDVEQALIDNDMSTTDLAAVVIEETGQYGIRYGEIVALNTAMIQHNMLEVDMLKEQIEELRTEIQKIKGE